MDENDCLAALNNNKTCQKTTFPSQSNQLDTDPKVMDWISWNFESSLMAKDKFNRFQGTTIFTAYFYPFCKDIERYENLVKYMVQFFVFDDHTESDWGDVARNSKESRKIWGQFESALDKLLYNKPTSMTSWKPYVLAMYSVFENIFSQYNDVQKNRCVQVWKHYIQGNVEETEALNSGVIEFTDIQQMIQIRIKSIGFRPAVQFIEYADDVFLPEEDWNDPRLQALIDMMSEIFVYVNDFFSFEKEFTQQNGDLRQMFNLVALISQLNDITIKQALGELAHMTRDMEQKIKDAENEILDDPDCSEAKTNFIKRMDYFVGGNHKVSSVLDRYNKFNH